MNSAKAPKFFKTQADVRKWLEKNHDKKTELWIGFYKKGSKKVAASNAEVLDEMLCFGWIDGVRNALDDVSYVNRYTPRGPRSRWSKINTQHVQRLTKLGLMTEAGLNAVEEAKADGRWAKAYDSAKTAEMPEAFLKELKKNKKAAAFYKTLSKQNIYAIVYRLQNSKKTETRDRWIERIIGMLAKGETFHP
jgi:uncharacterized protein YdeI (YjbR/CyaY-like superfamily)